MQELPQTQGGPDVLTDTEFDQGLAKMSNGKACGLDNIPAEIYKTCPECNRTL